MASQHPTTDSGCHLSLPVLLGYVAMLVSACNSDNPREDADVGDGAIEPELDTTDVPAEVDAEPECIDSRDCDDGDPCTMDSCVSGECAHVGIEDSEPCGDGVVCCSGACVECCVDSDCDDGDDCTVETCNPDGPTCESTDATGDRPYKRMFDLRVTTNDAASMRPKLQWAGSEYGLVWVDERDGHRELYFKRISSIGALVGDDLRATELDADISDRPRLRWSGSEYALAWLDNRHPGNTVYFRRLANDGTPASDEYRVTYREGISPSLAWSGSEYGISWAGPGGGGDEVFFARLSSTGIQIGDDYQFPDTYTAYTTVAWSGSEFMMIWPDESTSPRYHFITVDSLGVPRPSGYGTTDVVWQGTPYPDMVWADGEYGLAWQDTRDGNFEIYFARISTEGDLVGFANRITTTDRASTDTDIIWTGSEYAIAWEDHNADSYEVYLVRLAPDGSRIGGNIRVAFEPDTIQGEPSIVWSGSEYGVAWTDWRHGHQEIYFNRVGFCL